MIDEGEVGKISEADIIEVMSGTLDHGRISALVNQFDPENILNFKPLDIVNIQMTIGKNEELVRYICQIMLEDRHTSLDDVLDIIKKKRIDLA